VDIVTIAKLDKSDIEDAISVYLDEKGYKVSEIDFTFQQLGPTATRTFNGATIHISKKEAINNEND
jgi:hypothetical protein